MALIKCAECSRVISSEASACPGCGAKPKPRIGRLGAISIIILGGFVLSTIANTISPPPPAPPSAPQPTEAQMAEKAAIKAAAQKRFTATVGVLTSIKSAMRDPDSLKWQDIRANDDGSVVCVVYRARNGFGGMNLEHASFAGKSISTSDASWNKHCANKSLYEMGHAKFASSLT